MRTKIAAFLGLVACTALTAALLLAPADAKTKRDPQREVFAAESSFAATMAARDIKAFAEFVDKEAVFFGRKGPVRGRDMIVKAWTPFFEGPTPPFSWSPGTVEVLESGTLALSTGPVLDEEGKLVSNFSSIWRLDHDGKWRVVFDKGCAVCETTGQ
jgi:ketosteroid isomerase-like protein